MRAAITVAGLLVASHAHAQTPSHTCRPVTIGQAVLDQITKDFNLGFDNEKPDADVRGFQLHIDADNNAIPDTSFVKWPDPWPVRGTDARNRQSLGPASFIVAGDKDFNITLSINDLNATSMEVDFSCHPDEFGMALKDGAIRAELDMEAMGDEPEIQLAFNWHIKFDIPNIIKVDSTFTVDLADVDMPNDSKLKIIAALVPEVTADNKSIKLHPHVNVDDVTNEVTYKQLIEEVGKLELLVTPLLAEVVCLPTGLGGVCTSVVQPIVGVLVAHAVEVVRTIGIEKLKLALAGYVKCFLEPFNRTPPTDPMEVPPACNIWSPPAPGENKFVEKLGDRLREQLAKLELPKRIKELPIPNYDTVSKYEPELVRNLCPAP